MRITKGQLRQIIKEELAQTLEEQGFLSTIAKKGRELGQKAGEFFGGGEQRSEDEVQADIDATNASLKSGDMSAVEASKALTKLGREKSDITGVSPTQQPGALTGLPITKQY